MLTRLLTSTLSGTAVRSSATKFEDLREDSLGDDMLDVGEGALDEPESTLP